MYIDDILKEIARKDKVSPEYVREQMQLAILDIYSKQDQSPFLLHSLSFLLVPVAAAVLHDIK